MIERPKPEYRSGIGTDIHELVVGRKLMLCGIEIKHPAGLAGHSDADVGLHAVIDALLGAAAMGDIGTFFPDNDERWKDADSRDMVLIVKNMLEEKDWEIANVDIIIHAVEPRLEPYKAQMKRCVASLLGIDFNVVNVKAKTDDGFGPTGDGDAIAATVITLLKKKFRRSL